jgi:hypothetical protein
VCVRERERENEQRITWGVGLLAHILYPIKCNLFAV